MLPEAARRLAPGAGVVGDAVPERSQGHRPFQVAVRWEGPQVGSNDAAPLAGKGGVNDCGNAENCVKVCPKHIPLTESIAAVGRSLTFNAIAKWFRG